MILCADYDRVTCPVECVFAENTESYNLGAYFDYGSTMSNLYGTDACTLSWRRSPMYGVKDSLDKIRVEISRATDEALEKILNSAGIDIRYFELHPQEFRLEKMPISDLVNSSINVVTYYLFHEDDLLGSCTISTAFNSKESKIDVNVKWSEKQ